jgi:two-component system invasion response regulator UvrY
MDTSVNSIKVAYADDHLVVRKGISILLEAQDNIKVIIEAGNGLEMLNELSSCEIFPDVCLIDINMPVMNGHALLKAIRKRWPGLPCIILSALLDEYHVRELVRAGARGYLLKTCSPKELSRAIREVIHNGYYYNAILEKGALSTVPKVPPGMKSPVLNEREIEFMHLMCSDLKYSEIAVRMGTTFKTIDGLRARLCEKFNVHSRVCLVIAAIGLGYYTVEQSVVPNAANRRAS